MAISGFVLLVLAGREMVHYGSLAVPIVVETGCQLKALSKRRPKRSLSPGFMAIVLSVAVPWHSFALEGKPVFNRFVFLALDLPALNTNYDIPPLLGHA